MMSKLRLMSVLGGLLFVGAMAVADEELSYDDGSPRYYCTYSWF
jgi:hypothetical protein